MSRLSRQERILCFVNMIVFALVIAMTVSVGFILPKYIRLDDYVSGSGQTEKQIAKDCKCYSRKSIYFTVEGIKRSSALNNQDSTKKVTDNLEGKFEKCNLDENVPYLVSAFLSQYENDQLRLKFVCLGFIVSPEWVAVSKTCVRESWQWKELKIRSGKNRDSLREVEGLGKPSNGKLSGLQFLNVNPPFDLIKEGTKSLNIRQSKQNKQMSELYTVGWDSNGFKSLVVEKWIHQPCKGCSKGVLTNRQICSYNIDGRPLISRDGTVIGYLKTRNCSEYPGASVFGDVYETVDGGNAKDIEIYGHKCFNY